MLPTLDIGRGLLRTTAVRLIMLLTFVLAPIGLIAVYQTQQLNKQIIQQAEATRLARVIKAAHDQREVIDRAVGIAKAIGVVTLDVDQGDPACDVPFQRIVASEDDIRFAGLLPESGVVTCSSATSTIDLSDDENLATVFEQPSLFADATATVRGSGAAVVIVGVPVMDQNNLLHYSTVSVSQDALVPKQEDDPGLFEDATALILFNSRGDILSAERGIDTVEERLPIDRSLLALASEPVIFRHNNMRGEPRVFTVVPLYEGVIYVLASWPVASLQAGIDGVIPAWLFPIFMWLTTLAVAYVAVNRQVLRHTSLLGLRMRRFAQNRRLPDLKPDGSVPAEFAEMDRNFRNMAESILHDEAELENALNEKNVLLREVHHRVKNNLQLIASIMNMQIRKSRNSETGVVVRRLQDRVLSLAAVHQKIYQAETLSRIEMKELLDDILQKTLFVNLPAGSDTEVEVHMDSILLHPDQAVPLALLLAEASTNAVKYGGPKAEGERPYVRIRLDRMEGGAVHLVFANSVNTESERGAEQVPTLGTQLIRAFCTQLGGTLDITEEQGEYRLSTRFAIADYKGDDTEDPGAV